MTKGQHKQAMQAIALIVSEILPDIHDHVNALGRRQNVALHECWKWDRIARQLEQIIDLTKTGREVCEEGAREN